MDRNTDAAFGFAAMGKPISPRRREAAYETCRGVFGLDSVAAIDAVFKMANCLERDEPFNAFEVGLRYLDITGVYRLVAVLLTA